MHVAGYNKAMQPLLDPATSALPLRRVSLKFSSLLLLSSDANISH